MRCVSFTLAAFTALLLAACAPEEPAAKPAAPPMPSESLTRPPQALARSAISSKARRASARSMARFGSSGPTWPPRTRGI
ncbi:MAG: hypothetical protein B7Z22_03105 [Hyphomonas sp. 32-62-5]|nr:MAG: hypothetical protein B7Z22_03105 [Hyphomonas sp. 32-62-5]